LITSRFAAGLPNWSEFTQKIGDGMSEQFTFDVNGSRQTLDLPGHTPLLFALRNHIGLRGTRHGCGEGDCGACTVLVDGQPATACTTPIESIAGKHIETIDSLADAGPEQPLVAAFIAEQAGQCGYCVAGILMQAKALLARNPTPSRTEIAEALDGNLCRCGAHNRMLRAIENAAKAMRTEAGA
jgi:nicotinate dehydrogenase subunit A